MNPEKHRLSYKEAINFLIQILDQNFITEFDYVKNTLTAYNTFDQKQFKYNYPLILNLTENIIKDKNLLNNCIQRKPPVLVILIQAGNAALGLFDGESLIHHKVIRKYMTRKKQGKSQIKYLKTKGKSRAGSRIRLANSVIFFEEINQYLNDWSVINETTIIYSCTPTLWGMLYQSKILPPFKKKDKRLKKLPLNIDIPNFEVLKKATHFSEKGYIHLMPDCQDEVRQSVLKTIEKIKLI